MINQLPVSVARWQHESQDMLWDFYLVKNHETAFNSIASKAREKWSTDLESLELYKFDDLITNKIYLTKLANDF